MKENCFACVYSSLWTSRVIVPFPAYSALAVGYATFTWPLSRGSAKSLVSDPLPPSTLWRFLCYLRKRY